MPAGVEDVWLLPVAVAPVPSEVAAMFDIDDGDAEVLVDTVSNVVRSFDVEVANGGPCLVGLGSSPVAVATMLLLSASIMLEKLAVSMPSVNVKGGPVSAGAMMIMRYCSSSIVRTP